MDQELRDRIGPRKALETALVGYLDEHYLYWQGDLSLLPDGLQVEMHPLTRHKILCDPDVDSAGSGVFAVTNMPVKINMDLQPGEWRLVHVTVDVKTAGRFE